MKKTTGIIFGSIAGSALLIPLLVIAALILPTVVLFVGSLFIAPEPKPQIRYGEFPFTIEYEVMGEPYTIEDTVVCEFDGYYRGELGRKCRKWKSYLKSGNEYLIVYQTDDVELLISLALGSELGRIYMGDPNRLHEDPFLTLGYRTISDGIPGKFELISEEKLWEQYQFKLTHVEFSEPIQNTFK